jgi:hypothetical protein
LVETPGYCSRVTDCSLAESGVPVMVALEKPFLCPECGNPLVPPSLDTIGPSARKVALLAAAFASVAIAAGATVLVNGGFFERHGPAPAETAAVIPLAPATLAVAASVATPDALADIPPVTLAVEEAGSPSRARGKVTRKTDAVAALADGSLTHPAARHHANVHMALSIPLVSGGLPDYPDAYQDGRSGNVTVACALQPDGTPTQCRTTRLSGGRIFDVAVHTWLDLRDVRFQMARPRHRAPIHSVTLGVQFIGDSPPP